MGSIAQISLQYCIVPFLKNKSCSKSTSQWTYHRKSLTYFTFHMFSSCFRGTKTGNHRYRYQSPTHVKINPNLHDTFIPTPYTSIKSSTFKFSNLIRTGGGVSLNLHGSNDTTIMKMGRWFSLKFLMYIHNQIGDISKGLTQTMIRPIPFLKKYAIKT